MKLLLTAFSLILLAGCSGGPWARAQAYGVYMIHPTFGLMGIGMVEYQRVPVVDDPVTEAPAGDHIQTTRAE